MASLSTDNTQYTRLHITPLDETLLNIVIPSSVLPNARNISYHILQTFPEKRYGFIDLPVADAEKLKKKLNGAILKGTKMRIEKAKPESIVEPTGEIDLEKEEKDKEKRHKDKSKKRKREINVVPAVELEDRKVKRGWTTTEQDMIKEKREKTKRDKKDKVDKQDRKLKDEKKNRKDGKDGKDGKDKKKDKRKTKSKYTDRPECLFKTKLPESAPTKDSDDATGHKKRRKGDREVVVHEFAKTVKYPSFLKSTTTKTNSGPVTFEDGVGWVDSEGNVVEAVSIKRPPRTAQARATTSKAPKPTPAGNDDDETSSSGTSSDSDSDSSDQESDSSEEVGDDGNEASENPKVETQTLSSPSTPFKPEGGRKRSSGSFSSLTIKIPAATPAKVVHPLEALYKRPKDEAGNSQSAPKEPEPFSFFDNADVEEDDTVAPRSQPPMTPFTKQDFEYRNVRSAAPTPDTAHPSRSFNLWPRADTLKEALEEEEEEEEDEDEGEEAEGQDEEDTAMANFTNHNTDASAADDSTEVGVSDFQKQFWESRGELNRKWKRRRKTAAKEKRYRENRARAQRAI